MDNAESVNLDKLRALATNMIERKKAQTEPYILILGAGASISSGCSEMMAIVNDVIEKRDHTRFVDWQKQLKEAENLPQKIQSAYKKQIDKEKRERFSEIWKTIDDNTQYGILKRHLSENKQPSAGYSDLACLVKNGFFKMIISTNLDPLLEKALINAGCVPPNGFVTLANRKDTPEAIKEHLMDTCKPLTLLKLHGTLESPSSYAFLPEELFELEKSIKPFVSQIVNRSLIIVGYSMEDRDVEELFDADGKEIHYINPCSPDPESRIKNILKVRGYGSEISGSLGEFDNFFRQLRVFLDSERHIKNITDGPSIDDFLRSVGLEQELKNPYSRFKNLPTLYVKPVEYKEICKKLEKSHTIFIIGEPHLGKTYTAFFILWEYYKKGYEIKHIRHEQLIMLLHQHDNNMKNVLLSLFVNENGSPRIIHFDDPFGETMERRTDKFAKSLDEFLRLTQEYEHLRVIVTSRLNIFRQAVAELYDLAKVAALEKDIRVHTSYPRSNLLDLLHRYINFYKPQWSLNRQILDVLDEKLPDLLPAPHNIEFFVSTSQNLQTLNEVFRHVENCKVMRTALAEWMWTMPDHEQIFLMWLEICSSANILFPGESISTISMEDAYTDTLAYLFRTKKIDGIPTLPFSQAREKLDMIIFERTEINTTKLDFVHPSYHEAFWYAIKNNDHFSNWWQILRQKIGPIAGSSTNGINKVQLAVIERYGHLNRDLNQLLVAASESRDVNEQIIAIGHMLERPKLFESSDYFFKCYKNILKNGNSKQKIMLLKLADKNFEQLPPVFLNEIIPLSYNDQHVVVRLVMQKSINDHLGEYEKRVGDATNLRIYQAGKNLFNTMEKLQFIGAHYEQLLQSGKWDIFFVMHKTITRFIEGNHKRPIRDYGFLLPRQPYKDVSIIIGAILSEDFALLLNVELPHSFNQRKWNFAQSIMFLTLLYYPKLSVEKKRILGELSKNGERIRDFRKIVAGDLFKTHLLAKDTLIDLLAYPDNAVQFCVLKELLKHFDDLDEGTKGKIYALVKDPLHDWVGAAMGTLTSKKYSDVSPTMKELLALMAKTWPKDITGAMAGQMLSNFVDKSVDLQPMYQTALRRMCKDPEIVDGASKWLNYLHSSGIINERRWLITLQVLKALS